MIPITLGTNPSSSPDPNASLRKRAAEFEGMLLSQILEKLRDSYRMPGAEETDSAGESFQSLAHSALGKGLANQGGLGLTDMLIQSLTRNSPGSEVKKSIPPADQVPEVGGNH